jgi:hypothetical protein
MRLTGNRCRCSGCGEYFNSVSIFDRHRAGDWQERGANRRCLTVDQMLAKGYLKNAAGFWIEKGRAARSLTETLADEISQNPTHSEGRSPIDAFEALAKVAGNAWDGVDAMEYVRQVRS